MYRPSDRNTDPPSSQCFYHSVDTSAGGLLFLDGIIRPVVSVSITGLIHLLNQQRYRLSDGTTDYWADDTLGES
jgi:hypothetical protein